MKTHKDLEVWQKSIELVSLIYQHTKQFPSDEKFGLTNQIRRAAVSIPSNIAEGAARSSEKDYLRFLYISRGSLSEIDTQLLISKNLGYLSQQNFDVIISKINHIHKMLNNLIKYFKSKTTN